MYPKVSPIPRSYRFDDFEADNQTGTLSRDGEKIPIQELPFQLLTALLERPGELVSREELRERLWPAGVHLDFDISLATAVKKLRQALGDPVREPRYIETLPGRGYRFLGEVMPSAHLAPARPLPWQEVPPASQEGQGRVIPFNVARASEPVPDSTRSRHRLVWGATVGLALLLAAGALALARPWRGGSTAVLPGRPSVVALPTKVFGAPESAFLGDAIPSTLSTMLVGVEGLDTKLPPSSAQVEKVQGDVARVAEAYKANFLILTTVTTEGDRLRLNVQLAEASTQKIHWASQYEANRDNYNGLLRDAAGALVRVLKPGVAGPSGTQSSERSEVELALQEGRYFMGRYWVQGQAKDYDRARWAFDRALKLNPSSPRVLSVVANSYWEKWNRDGDRQALKDAEPWARRAIERDPRSEAWAVLALIESCQPRVDLEKAVEWGVNAIRYAPREPGVHGAFGGVAPAVRLMVECGLHARELDPLGNAEAGMIASGLIWSGRPGEALPILDKALAEKPEDPFVLAAKAYALVRLDRLPEAKALLDRCRPAPSPRVSFSEDYWNQVHFVLVAAQGDDGTSRVLARRLVVRYLDSKTDPANLVNASITMFPDLVRLGMGEEALQLFQRSVEMGYAPTLDWLALAPELKSLWREPRFSKVWNASRNQTTILVRHLDAAKTAGELPRYLEQPLAELKVLLERPAPA
jgi:DNA-binding winged helix-turn-helix (wHTH) protein/TolB-like protein